MIFNLALLFVLQLAPLQFLFRHRENLFHRIAEFVGRLLDLMNRCWHADDVTAKWLFEQTVLNKIAPSLVLKTPVGFEARPGDNFYEVRFTQLIQMEFGSFWVLSKRGTNLFALQCTVCSDKGLFRLFFEPLYLTARIIELEAKIAILRFENLILRFKRRVFRFKLTNLFAQDSRERNLAEQINNPAHKLFMPSATSLTVERHHHHLDL